MVEKWIVDGTSRVGSSVINKITTDKLNCEVHENLLDTEFTDQGIFCKTCGVKLQLVPEWIVGS